MRSFLRNTKYLAPALVFALAILLVFPAGCKKKDTTAVPPSAGGGTPAPDFSLKDTFGKSYKLSSMKGNVVLMEFMATWCPACAASAADYSNLYRRFKDRGVVVLAVSVDEGGGAPAKVRDFIKAYKVAYPILPDSKDVSAIYRVMSVPSTFLISKDGVIVRHYMGYSAGTADLLAKEIESLLDKK